MRDFFTQKTKSCLFLENEFHHAFSYKNCAGCAIRKSHLAVLVAICKLQLAVRKKASHKNVDEINPCLLLALLFSEVDLLQANMPRAIYPAYISMFPAGKDNKNCLPIHSKMQ